MLTLVIVLAFPAILFLGYGTAYALLRRKPEVLTGAWGFVLYLALLTIPVVAVLLDSPRALAERFVVSIWTPAWIAAGVAAGLTLWGVQRLVARREKDEARVWAGPPGWGGYFLLMLPVGYVVVAEEVVWRGYLTTEIRVLFASAAFALHHYHFGWRHVVFAFAAGLAWGALFLAEDRLYSAITSHLTYNALAWAWMRRPAGQGRDTQPGP
jgi:membrane protease YdiL (CAAX protease family)